MRPSRSPSARAQSPFRSPRLCRSPVAASAGARPSRSPSRCSIDGSGKDPLCVINEARESLNKLWACRQRRIQAQRAHFEAVSKERAELDAEQHELAGRFRHDGPRLLEEANWRRREAIELVEASQKEHEAANKQRGDEQRKLREAEVEASALADERARAQEALNQIHAKLADTKAQSESTMAEAMKVLLRYSEVLDYKVLPGTSSGEVRIVFSGLNPAEPSQQCSATIRWNKEAYLYEASSCSPSLPQLPELLHALNDKLSGSDAAMASFSSGLRTAFKLHCMPAMAAGA